MRECFMFKKNTKIKASQAGKTIHQKTLAKYLTSKEFLQ